MECKIVRMFFCRNLSLKMILHSLFETLYFKFKNLCRNILSNTNTYEKTISLFLLLQHPLDQ